jgi:uncharacterized protein YqeY
MSAYQDRLQAEIKDALKAGEKEKVSTLRLLLSSVKNEEIRLGDGLDEAQFLHLVQKAIKQRGESAEQYRKGDRPELAEREEREADFLGAYLPPPVSEEELQTAIRDFVEQQELSGPGAIGPIMREMMARFSGRADGATINRLARQVLAQSG